MLGLLHHKETAFGDAGQSILQQALGLFDPGCLLFFCSSNVGNVEFLSWCRQFSFIFLSIFLTLYAVAGFAKRFPSYATDCSASVCRDRTTVAVGPLSLILVEKHSRGFHDFPHSSRPFRPDPLESTEKPRMAPKVFFQTRKIPLWTPRIRVREKRSFGKGVFSEKFIC